MADELLNAMHKIFDGAISQVIAASAGIDIFKAEEDKLIKKTDTIAAVISISKEHQGLVIIKMSEKTAKKLTLYMTGEEEPSRDELLDCAAELGNMFCGVSKMRLADAGFSVFFEVPFTVKGENLDFHFKKGTQETASYFTDGDISISLRIILF